MVEFLIAAFLLGVIAGGIAIDLLWQRTRGMWAESLRYERGRADRWENHARLVSALLNSVLRLERERQAAEPSVKVGMERPRLRAVDE